MGYYLLLLYWALCGALFLSPAAGVFRAPARPTFALGGKSRQKRHLNLRFKNPPALWLFGFDTISHAVTEQIPCRVV